MKRKWQIWGSHLECTTATTYKDDDDEDANIYFYMSDYMLIYTKY